MHAGKITKEIMLGWSDPCGLLATSIWRKVGSLQPITVFARVQIDRRATRNLLLLGHLLDRQSDREGDAYGDLCVSCTRHLPALQIAIEAL